MKHPYRWSVKKAFKNFFGRRVAFFVGALGLLPSLGVAQGVLRVDFESAAARELWISAESPAASAQNAQKTEAKSIEVPLEKASAKDRLFVWDKTSGNLAIKELKEFFAPTTPPQPWVWSPKPEEFRLIFKVIARVEHQARPVASATVHLTDGKRKQTQVLSPADKGEIVFYALQPGQIKLEVLYKAGGATKTLPAQSFEVNLKRDQPEPKLTLVISDSVETLSAPPQPEQNQPKETPKKEEPRGVSTLGGAFIYLLALAIAIGVGYFVLVYVQKNRQKVAAQLAKVGVNLPGADDEDLGPITPIGSQPQPQQKIVLDDSEPTPIGQPIQPILSGTPAVLNPRLVGEDGSVMLLLDGVSVLGRDEGLEHSLIGQDTVSRRHAEFERAGDEVKLRDLSSTNGTYVNGAKVSAEVSLQPGDRVQFGAVAYRYEV